MDWVVWNPDGLFWLVLELLPYWLVVSDSNALEGYYSGGTTLYSSHHFKPWIVPTLVWTVFILVLFFMMLCICRIVRWQWIEKEKLTYPIIHLPLEISAGKPFFFRNKLMWIGLFLAALISLNNGLHFFFSYLPEIPVKRRAISHLFNDRPWNLMGGVKLSFYHTARPYCDIGAFWTSCLKGRLLRKTFVLPHRTPIL